MRKASSVGVDGVTIGCEHVSLIGTFLWLRHLEAQRNRTHLLMQGEVGLPPALTERELF